MSNIDLVEYEETNDVFCDLNKIIDSAKVNTYKLINYNLLVRNWLLGCRIQNEFLKNIKRAEYGEEIINKLSISLTKEYGIGFSSRNLYSYIKFL